MASFAGVRAFLNAPAATTAIASPWANVASWIALAPLGLAFAFVMAVAPWHSNFDVDSFTRYVQILAIADHGDPGFENGPVEGHRELTPAWTFPAHGRAYGPYPVLCDGVLAVGAKLDGFRGIMRMIWLLFAEGCVFTYALTYRLTKKPAIAVAAAYALALGTSCAFWGTMVAPFIPGGAFAVTAAYFLTVSYGATSPKRSLALAAAGGLFASFALGSHLVWSPAWMLVPVACAWTSRRHERLTRPLAYFVGSAPGLAVMGLANHVRFDTYNPFSYGPCDVWGCLDRTTAENAQNGTIFVKAALPYAPYVILFALACWLVRRSARSVAVLVFVGALAGLVPSNAAGDLFRRLARVLWALLFDMGSVDVGFPKWGDDPGTFHGTWIMNGVRYSGPWCVRSVFQCAPFLIAALLPLAHGRGFDVWGAGAARVERRGAYGVLAATCVGVLTAMLMRANMPASSMIGSPILNSRHLATMLPACTVLAFVALAELPFRVWHVGLAGLVAVVGIRVLSQHDGDEDLLRRQVTHWLPLGLAFGTWLFASAARVLASATNRQRVAQVTALSAALAVGYGPAVTWGIDRVAAKTIRTMQQSSVDEVRRCTPNRLILVGAAAMMQGIGLLDEKKILYVDVTMAPGNVTTTQLLLSSMSDEMPAFLMDEDPGIRWTFDWPGLAFEDIPGCGRVRRIVRTAPVPEPIAPPEPSEPPTQTE